MAATTTARAEVDAWLEPARGGDEAALEQLFLLLVPRVRNLVRYLVRGDKEVDDLSQEALLKILRGLDAYRSDGAFYSWADRIVARSVFARIKRERSTLVDEDIDQLQTTATLDGDSPDSLCDRRKLVQLLDRLPNEQRDALVLHHVVGMSIREVASELNAREETIRSRMRLGKDRLKQWMAPNAVLSPTG